MSPLLNALLVGGLLPFLTQLLAKNRRQVVSPVAMGLSLLWVRRLRRSKAKARWAYDRLATQRFWNEARGTSIFLTGVGLAGLLAVPGLAESYGGLALSGAIGLLGGGVLQMAFWKNRVAYDQQDGSYRDAIRLLPQMPHAEAEQALLAALPYANEQTAQALQNHSAGVWLDAPSYKILLAQHSRHPKQHLTLLQEVYAESPSALVPHLDSLLTDDQPEVRQLGGQLLKLLPREALAEVNLRMLNRKDDTQRQHYMEVLQEHPELLGPTELEYLLHHNWPRLRLSGALLVAKQREARWVPVLLQQLSQETYEYVQLALLRALHSLPLTPDAVALLLHFANSGYSRDVTRESLLLLKQAGHLAPVETAALMTHLLVQPSLAPSISGLALDTLEAIGPDVLPDLLNHLEKAGHEELIHPHLPKLQLQGPDAWQQLPAEMRTEKWHLLLQKLRQEDNALRTTYLIGDLLSETMSIKTSALKEIVAHPSVRYLPVLKQLLKQVRQALEKGISFDGTENLATSERVLLEGLKTEAYLTIEHCLKKQPPALRAAGALAYCLECRCRCAAGTFGDRHYTYCPRCLGDLHAVAKAASVVGRIGGTLPASSPETLYLSLWDETSKTALPAQIDILELAPDPDVTHDWALTALLEAAQQQRFSLTDVPVLMAEGLVLSTNSQRILLEAGLALAPTHNSR